MNTIKAVAVLVALSGLVVTAVNAADYTATTVRDTRVAAYQPMGVEVPVNVETQMDSNVIEVAPVVIVTKRAPKAVHQDQQCGAFQFRNVVQGPVGASVRGFCGTL